MDPIQFLRAHPPFDRLMSVPEFAQFFLVDLSERLRQSSASRPLPLGRELGTSVGLLPVATPVWVPCETPLYLLRNIERAALPEDMARYDTDLAAMVETLVWGGLAAAQIGSVVSRLNDALVARFLRIAEEEIGPPPVPYAWIVFGSEGRMEQTLLTDQDNAIVYADAEGAHEAYFKALAERTVRALVVAAFPPCPGGFMATNWRRPLSSWIALFRDWIEKPEPRALIEALNFLDFRAVHGGLDLAELDGLLLRAGREQIFMAHLARASIGMQPPLGAFRHIRETEDGVDLKKGGLAPIVSLARLYALEAGCTSRSTLERLEGAAHAGTLSRQGSDTLAEGFRFLLGLRLREQLRALRAGGEVRNHIRLEHLATVERQHLKDIFVAIREIQHAADLRYAVQRLA